VTPLPRDDESVDLRLRAMLVVGESVEPEIRELGSCVLLSSREEVAQERGAMTRMTDGSGTVEWRSQLLYENE
jgi:hypothetical protein